MNRTTVGRLVAILALVLIAPLAFGGILVEPKGRVLKIDKKKGTVLIQGKFEQVEVKLKAVPAQTPGAQFQGRVPASAIVSVKRTAAKK